MAVKDTAPRRSVRSSPKAGWIPQKKSKPLPRRVVHVSASDSCGGAARGAFRLHQALRKNGEDSHMYVLNQDSKGSAIHRYQPPDGLLPRLQRMFRKEYLRFIQKPYQHRRPQSCEHFRDDRSPYGNDLWDQMPAADILNLHWVAGFIDYRKFFSLAATTPVVWTIHDMNPFTGGCHYDLGCGRYEGKCGVCPQLGSVKEYDLSRRIHRRKQQALRQLDPEKVRIVAGSYWLAAAARKSRLFSDFNVTTIHYGLDPTAFRPRNRMALRASLEIPESAFVVLFAADELHNQRKGLPLLLKALQQMAGQREVYLLSVGDGACTLNTPFVHIHLGRFTSDDMLSIFYSAGDCFIIPSLQEVFGLTALEAMACGTPVIGFATGGIPDMVKPGRTGLLAESNDVGDLAEKIFWMMEHPEETRRMGRNARALVEREFTVANQARKYSSLYEELEQTISISKR